MKRITADETQHLFMQCNKCGSKHRKLERLEKHLKGCKKCSYCGGTGIKVINGKDKICISCLGKGEGDAW